MEKEKNKDMPTIIVNVYYNDNRMDVEKDESTFVENAIVGDNEGDS